MDNKKEPTKELLANCLKELVLSTPFDKITIKMITDKAHVIRPTFYKHFQDKYEVIEWLFDQDIKQKVNVMLDNHMEPEAIKLLFICLEKDRDYYRKLYASPGPNSIESIIYNYIFESFYNLLKKHLIHTNENIVHLPPKFLAQFYTFGLSDTIKEWLTTNNTASAEQICNGYYYIMGHSIFELLKQ